MLLLVLLSAMLLNLSRTRAQQASPRLTVTSDLDCVVGIDGKIVARIQAGKQEALPVVIGKHVLSAATADGDYWEQPLEVGVAPVPPIAIPLQKTRSERIGLEANRAALQAQVGQMKDRLASIKQENDELARNPELILAERRMIVEAMNHYADIYGKEMGLYDTGIDYSKQLEQTGAIFSAIPSTGLLALAETIQAAKQEDIARHHQMAADAAAARMRDLEVALKDPLKRARSADETSYLVMVREVVNGKKSGWLITAPDRIEYRDDSRSVRLTCVEVRGVSGGGRLRLHYGEPKAFVGPGTGKHLKRKEGRKESLDLKAAIYSDQELLLTDAFLACPKLTE
jgi:hypothetical protein